MVQGAPAVAFVLSGSTKGLEDWASFMRHVVLSYAASPARSAIVALLKPLSYNGRWLNVSTQRQLARILLAQAKAALPSSAMQGACARSR